MADEIITTESVLDENTRRYYLDAMGIQCWQSLETKSEAESNIEKTRTFLQVSRSLTKSTGYNLKPASSNVINVSGINQESRRLLGEEINRPS